MQHHACALAVTSKKVSKVATIFTALAAVAALGLSGCASGSAGAGSDGVTGQTPKNTVTIIVHNSFPNEEFAAAASKATGYEVKVITAGDGGELTSQLVLTKQDPVADLFFGVDNVFASRIATEGVSDPYLPSNLPARAQDYLYDDAGTLVPIDLGTTCINIDPAWFQSQGMAEPSSYEDLADPRYKGLTVLLDPATSSTGASFLVGTIAKFGEDGFAAYWEALANNDVRIAQEWSEAYYGHFTQGGEGGSYPIVLSYNSSPAWTVSEDGASTSTKALLDTCSSQIEYAGVLKGAANPKGAQAVIDFMLSREFQDTIADSMYVYPIDAEAYVPTEWEQFAPFPTALNDLSAAEIGAGRDNWLKAWSQATGW